MARAPYLHALPEFRDLLQIVARERGILPALVEKDYWIMQCLHGLTRQGYEFELKGGTSLSKGFGIIDRFSEDIDLRIDPVSAGYSGVATGKNQTKKPAHIDSRRDFYDGLARKIQIDGIDHVERAPEFDDPKYRSGGIRLVYRTHFDTVAGVKPGILLELGFDVTAPNTPVTISSWAYDHAASSGVATLDNRAVGVRCYLPEYTFAEKLQTVSTKFRLQQDSGDMPTNFMRHYYDLHQLLGHPGVQAFIGTNDYYEWKEVRFSGEDQRDITENEAFWLRDTDTRHTYQEAYDRIGALFYKERPSLDEILARIQQHGDRL